MAGLRAEHPTDIAGIEVVGTTDYATCAPMPVVGGLQKDAPQTLPSANVLEYRLAGDCKLIVRPSGTEPKIKAYVFTKAPTREASLALQDRLGAAAKELLG
jgi:phosphoglucomutase